MSPEQQLASFIAKYSPEIQAQAHEVLRWMRERLPNAVEMVYDNYNTLACGFGPDERVSDLIFSIALYPRWITLYFMQGVGLPDPDGLLQGSGSIVRSIRLKTPDDLDQEPVQTLIRSALDHAKEPLDPAQPYRLVIKSISARQRSRLPTK